MLDARKIAHIKSLQKDNGEIWAEAVVEDAKRPDSPINELFDWDDQRMAHVARLDVARNLIRSVRYEVRTTDLTLYTPYYVRNPDAHGREQSYISIVSIKSDAERSLAALENEIDRVRGLVRRTREVAASLNLSKECEIKLRDLL